MVLLQAREFPSRLIWRPEADLIPCGCKWPHTDRIGDVISDIPLYAPGNQNGPENLVSTKTL